MLITDKCIAHVAFILTQYLFLPLGSFELNEAKIIKFLARKTSAKRIARNNFRNLNVNLSLARAEASFTALRDRHHRFIVSHFK